MNCYKVEHYNAAEDGLVIIANKTESRSSQALVWHPLDVVSGAYMEREAGRKYSCIARKP